MVSDEKLVRNGKRGSEKLMAAWRARALTEESIREISDTMDKSPAKIESVNVVGGSTPTGLQMTLRYDGDDVPWCGNDILFWLKWHRLHGGVVHPPKILIDGVPWPETVRLQLGFGNLDGAACCGGAALPHIMAGGSWSG
jgi:hypothetical protein